MATHRSLKSDRFMILLSASLCVLSGCASPLMSSLTKFDALPSIPGKKSSGINQEQKLSIQLSLGRTLERQGDLERAELLYREILEKNSHYAPAIHRLAVVCDRQQRFDESKPLFQKALKLSPDDKVILGDYGYSLYRQQEWKAAEGVLRRALAVDPRDKKSHNHLGLVLAQTDRPEEAINEFRLAGCSASEANANMAVVMKLNGRETGVLADNSLLDAATPETSIEPAGRTSLATLNSTP